MKIFPLIKHIDDVLPHIQGIDDIKIIEKDGYTVVDYMHGFDSFNGNPETDLSCRTRRACRGLIFDTDGKLVSRPFHKFFNVGEREETLVDNIDWTKPHMVMDKLDGSMIRPVIINETFRLGTRKGITNVGNMAEDFMVSNPEIPYRKFCESLHTSNLTPIFEFHCTDNMVVIDYENPFMKLLAIRDTFTGVYYDNVELNDVAESWGIPTVDLFDADLSDPKSFLEKTSKEKDREGYVIRFDDSQKTYKVKNDWYFQLHHVISGLNSERNIVRLLIDNEIDDILPKLPDNRRKDIENFSKNFWDVYNRFFKKCDDVYDGVLADIEEGSERKAYAMRILKEDKQLHPILFKFLDGGDGAYRHSVVVDMVRSKTNKDNVFTEFMKWFEKQ